MTKYARAKRFMVIGFVLMGVGLMLTVLKLGFDVRSIDDGNLIVTFVGVLLAVVGARRRRAEAAAHWAPPRQADRFH